MYIQNKRILYFSFLISNMSLRLLHENYVNQASQSHGKARAYRSNFNQVREKVENFGSLEKKTKNKCLPYVMKRWKISISSSSFCHRRLDLENSLK